MLLERFKNGLINLFLEEQDYSVEAQSAVNLAFYKLIKSPSLDDTYPHFHMARVSSELFIPLHFESHVDRSELNLKPFNILSEHYHDIFDELPVGCQRLVKPKLEDLDFSIYHGGYSSLIESKCDVFLERLARKDELVEDVLLQSQPLPNLREVSYSWMDLEEMRTYLTDQVSMEAKKANRYYYRDSLKEFGIEFLKLKNSVVKNYYLIAQTPFDPVGGACVYHHQDKGYVTLSYLSVGPGHIQRGISTQMFKECLSFSAKLGCFSIRTAPSEHAVRNSISNAYDRLASEHPWPVVGHDDSVRLSMLKELVVINPFLEQWKDDFLKVFPNATPKLIHLPSDELNHLHSKMKDLVHNKLAPQLSKQLTDLKKF